MIAITARPANGFFRCGVHHPPKRTLHADDKFNKRQLKILKAEPNLVVQEGVPDPAPKQGAEAEKPAPNGAEAEKSKEESAKNAATGNVAAGKVSAGSFLGLGRK